MSYMLNAECLVLSIVRCALCVYVSMSNVALSIWSLRLQSLALLASSRWCVRFVQARLLAVVVLTHAPSNPTIQTLTMKDKFAEEYQLVIKLVHVFLAKPRHS